MSSWVRRGTRTCPDLAHAAHSWVQPAVILPDVTGSRDRHTVKDSPERRAKTLDTAGLLSPAVRAFLDDLAEIIAEDLWSSAQEAPTTPAKRTPTSRRRVKTDAQGRNLRPVFEQPATADIN